MTLLETARAPLELPGHAFWHQRSELHQSLNKLQPWCLN